MPENSDRRVPLLARIPGGVYWTVVALVVLALVYGYDLRGKRLARDHMALAEQYESEGLYDRAIAEYQSALANPRLARRDKGAIALKVGDIYLEHFEDFDRARAYYTQVKRYAPKLADDKAVQARMREAARRAGGAGAPPVAIDATTTPTVVQRVELVSEPAADRRGPVLAEFRGREIRAGAVERMLNSIAPDALTYLKLEPKQFDEILERMLEEELAYRAAMDAGMHRDPDVSQRLYDYQRTLLRERYLDGIKRTAEVVTNDEVTSFFAANRDKYREPARVGIGLIKAATEAEARNALEALRAGAVFGDAATSFSTHEASRGKRGVAGVITEGSAVVPGVGEAPEVANTLMAMQIGDITGVTKVGDAYYIFRIMSKTAGRDPSLDELRGQIESTIRAQKLQQVTKDLTRALRQTYEAKLAPNAAQLFYEYLSRRDANTTSVSGVGAPAGV
ncbi:MAG: peptidyl-prolyl cis-trans isomerase [Candidatus Sumerlaeaceae bacterium]|nr:peptidyl-prolyl cis-trans isomerase [Candidatus Sumerlaeaceae bacterium]